jgi:hypothetical protein
MKCPYSFTCDLCKKDYRRAIPKEQLLVEHEHRKKTVKGYDDGEGTVEVCDRCFRLYVEPIFLPIG